MRRVLLVDQDGRAAAALERSLLRLGCDVVSAYDGSSAITEAITGDHEVALIDIDGQDGDGVAVAQAIQMVDPNTLVVIMGSGPAEHVCAAARAADADGCVRKPIDPEELAMMLCTLISGETYKSCFDVMTMPRTRKAGSPLRPRGHDGFD